jgi:hypothetical protein
LNIVTTKPKIILQSRIREFKRRYLLFIFFALVPVIWAIFVSALAHYKGTAGFDFRIGQDGLTAYRAFGGAEKGDRIKGVWGVPHDRLFSYLFLKKDIAEQPYNFIIEKDGQLISAHVAPQKRSWFVIFKKAWSYYFLIISLVVCSLSAVFFSPKEQPAGPFLGAFISSAIINASYLVYHFGFSNPNLISLTYLTIVVANWLMFSSWAHFSLNFPVGRQLLINRPYIFFPRL